MRQTGSQSNNVVKRLKYIFLADILLDRVDTLAYLNKPDFKKLDDIGAMREWHPKQLRVTCATETIYKLSKDDFKQRFDLLFMILFSHTVATIYLLSFYESFCFQKFLLNASDQLAFVATGYSLMSDLILQFQELHQSSLKCKNSYNFPLHFLKLYMLIPHNTILKFPC